MNREDYLAKKKQNNQYKLDAGLVSDRYPDVSGIVIQMKYYREKSSNPVHMLRTVNFFPSSSAYFNMGCMMKECVNGGFNLTSVISSMVKKRKESGMGKMVCGGEISASDQHHSRISYEIGIQYKQTL